MGVSMRGNKKSRTSEVLQSPGSVHGLVEPKVEAAGIEPASAVCFRRVAGGPGLSSRLTPAQSASRERHKRQATSGDDELPAIHP